MALDPQVEEHYRGKKQKNVIGVLPIEQIRAGVDAIYNDSVKLVELGRTEEFEIPGLQGTDGGAGKIPVRLYQDTACVREALAIPGTAQRTAQRTARRAKAVPCPILLYFHGGGFIMHNLASHDNLCRKLAKETGCIVISVGYRLAPEHPFPAAIYDAWSALCWAAGEGHVAGGDHKRIFLAGDSAGATISAALSLYARDQEGPAIEGQILYYGTYGALLPEQSKSVELFGGGDYVLPREMMEKCDVLYRKGLGEQEQISGDMEPYFYPGKMTDLSMKTRTLLITAQYDPLRDDGETFAGLLQRAGNDVELYRMNGMMHGFMLLWFKFDRAQEIFEKTRYFIEEGNVSKSAYERKKE